MPIPIILSADASLGTSTLISNVCIGNQPALGKRCMVAIDTVYVTFADKPGNEYYDITANMTDLSVGVGTISGNPPPPMRWSLGQLATGNYNLHTLPVELEKMANYAGAANQANDNNGYDVTTTITSNIISYQTNASELVDVTFEAIDGAPVLGPGTFTATGGGDSAKTDPTLAPPRLCELCSFVITVLGAFEIYLNSEGSKLYGGGIDGVGDWYIIVNDVTYPTGVAAIAGDKVEWKRYGGTFSVTLTQGGNPPISLTYLNIMNRDTLYNLPNTSFHEIVAADIGVELQQLQITLQGQAEVTCKAGLNFYSDDQANLFGWLSTTAITDEGKPAIIVADTAPEGDTNNPPFNILLGGGFNLESYDYGSTTNSKTNVLKTVVDSGTLGQLVTKDFNPVVPINLQNDTELNMSKLQISFENAINHETLSFVKQTVVSLLFYRDGERT